MKISFAFCRPVRWGGNSSCGDNVDHRAGKRYACLILVGFFLVLLTHLRADEVGGSKPTPADLACRDGLVALDRGDLAAARQNFDKSLTLNPKHVGALVGLAEVDLQSRKYEAALQYIHKASDIQPNNWFVQTVLGHYLFFQRRYAEAEAALKKAIALDASAARPHLELGDLYLVGMHRPQDAIPAYRAGLALDPKLARAHYALANALAETGDSKGAESEFSEAVRLDPQNPLMLEALGVFYTHHRQYGQALDAYSKALSVQPKFLPAYLARGDIFLAMGQRDKALDEYNAALKVAPNFADAYTKIGLFYEGESAIDKAEEAYLNAIKLDHKQAAAYNNLAWLEAQRKARLDEALAWAKRAVELQPGDTTFQDTLGWVYRTRGELSQAAAVLQKAVATKSPDPEALYHLGVVYTEKGQPREARASFEKALAQKKDFPEADDAKSRLAALNRPH
jgi:tetratricopeptide (TPR) repeat protein